MLGDRDFLPFPPLTCLSPLFRGSSSERSSGLLTGVFSAKRVQPVFVGFTTPHTGAAGFHGCWWQAEWFLYLVALFVWGLLGCVSSRRGARAGALGQP